jgi:hypothetical protein
MWALDWTMPRTRGSTSSAAAGGGWREGILPATVRPGHRGTWDIPPQAAAYRAGSRGAGNS